MSLSYWSIVVGGKGVHNQLLLPKAAKKNKEGKPIVLKGGDVWLEYLPLSEVTTRAVKEYATPKDALTNTDKKVKDVFNDLKTLIKTSQHYAVFYHSRNDPCTLCPNNHYHIVIGRSEQKQNDDLDRNYRYRAVRRAARDDGPIAGRMVYSSYQRVKALPNLIKYLSNSPRIFYGTNFGRVIDWYKEERGSPEVTQLQDDDLQDCPPSDVLGVNEEDGLDEQGFPQLDLITEDDVDEAASAGPSSEFLSDDSGFVTEREGPPAKRQKTSEPDYIPRLAEIMASIMTTTRSTDGMQIRIALDKRVAKRIPGAKNELARLKNVEFNKQRNRIWECAIKEYRARLHQSTFSQLCQSAWQHLSHDPDYDMKYIPLDTSVNLLIDWLIDMAGTPVEFLTNLKGVLKRTNGKLNTFFCMGTSNAGKTVMFAKPVEFIMCSVGRIVSLNQADRFIFENCVGQRLISIEECLVPKMHMEEIKKIMGGEDCQINVKYCREGALLVSTPVIATANQPPWSLEASIEVPLRNRMYYYEFNRAFRALEDWPGRALDPRAYIVCWCALGAGRTLTDLYDIACLTEVVEAMDKRFKPEILPLDDPGKYKLYGTEIFEFKPEDADIVIVGYLKGLPVLDPCYFGTRRCRLDKLASYCVKWLMTDPTRFWVECSCIVGEFRIVARFLNCLIGCPLNYGDYRTELEEMAQCTACPLNHGPPVSDSSTFINYLERLAGIEGAAEAAPVYQWTSPEWPVYPEDKEIEEEQDTEFV